MQQKKKNNNFYYRYANMQHKRLKYAYIIMLKYALKMKWNLEKKIVYIFVNYCGLIIPFFQRYIHRTRSTFDPRAEVPTLCNDRFYIVEMSEIYCSLHSCIHEYFYHGRYKFVQKHIPNFFGKAVTAWAKQVTWIEFE